MTEDTNREFLRDVVENPKDDAVRLIYADWLEEQGLPSRAEFIRLQIGLEKFFADKGEVITVREAELINAWKEEWLRTPGFEVFRASSFRPCLSVTKPPEGPGDLVHGHLFYCDFRRGFVDRISAHAESWLAFGPELVRHHPVTRVRLHHKAPAAFDDEPAVWFRDMSDVPGWEGAGTNPAESIPGPIFDHMVGKPGGWYFMVEKYGDKRFDSVGDANEALSLACLKYARSDR